MQTVVSRARLLSGAALVVAAATLLNLAGAQAQTAGQNGTQTGTAAPGTAPIASVAASKAVLAGPATATYDNRWDIYGGLNYANGQAGQVLPKHYNMGGFEGMGTYWLTGKLGVAADFRWQGGTTPVEPIGAAYGFNRVAVYQELFMGGVQYRGPRGRYAATGIHALVGGTRGDFNSATNGFPTNANYPQGSPLSSCPAQENLAYQQGNLGLYCNTTAFAAALGASVDFNYSPRVAIRLQPDLTLEHFGTETREFFAISMGLVYRLGKR